MKKEGRGGGREGKGRRRKCVERGKAEYEIGLVVRAEGALFLSLFLTRGKKKVHDVRDQYGVTVGGLL